jgi:hypothetical protein
MACTTRLWVLPDSQKPIGKPEKTVKVPDGSHKTDKKNKDRQEKPTCAKNKP